MQGEGDEMFSSIFSDFLLLQKENDLIDKITKQNIPFNWIYRDEMLRILSINLRLQILNKSVVTILMKHTMRWCLKPQA